MGAGRSDLVVEIGAPFRYTWEWQSEDDLGDYAAVMTARPMWNKTAILDLSDNVTTQETENGLAVTLELGEMQVFVMTAGVWLYDIVLVGSEPLRFVEGTMTLKARVPG